MQVRVVARRALPLHGIVLAILCELLDLVVDLLIDQKALFHPAFRAAGAADFHETAVAVEHFQALAVFHQSHFVVDRCYPVAEADLRSRDIGNFQHASPAAIAGGKEDCASEREDERNSEWT